MRVSVVVACLVIAAAAHAGRAQDLARTQTVIHAQALASALQLLARERGVQILYRSDVVGDRRTGGATGRLTIDEALTQMLSGTGLTYRYLQNNAITIVTRSGREQAVQAGPGSEWQGSQRGLSTELSGAAAGAGDSYAWTDIRLAQGDVPRRTDSDVPSDDSATGDDVTGRGAQLQEVVVTARKREESLLKIPVAVSALSQRQLDDAAISSPAELSNYVSGFDFETNTGTGGRTNPDIRFRGQVQQVNTPSSQIGAIFWDGSYMGAGAGFVPFGDLERVEVIKGPQTAYFGRNTFSGAINYIPKMPGDRWTGKAELGTSPSQFQDVRVAGAIGGPIGEKVGVRIHAAYDKQGGDFAYGDGEPVGETRDLSASGTLVVTATDNLQLKLTGYYVAAEDSGGTGGILATVPAGQCNKTVSGEYVNVITGARTPFTRDLATLGIATFCGEIPRGDDLVFPVTSTPSLATVTGGASALAPATQGNPYLDKYGAVQKPDGSFGGDHRTWRLQGGLEYEFGSEHVLGLVASRAETGTTNVNDQGYGTLRNAAGQRIVSPTGTQRYIGETYVEGRLTSPQSSSFRYLFGVSQYDQQYRQGVAPSANTLDFQNNSTFGVFASADYDFLGDFTVSLEGRYAVERSDVLINGNPAVACGLVTLCGLKDSHKAFIPRAIVSYRPFEGTTTYVSYSRGSLLGVLTQAAFISSVAPSIIPDPSAFGTFTPAQKNTTYEIGWKQRGPWWSFTFDTYFTEWKNQPFASVVILPVGSSSFRGPGSSQSLGADIEFAADPTDWLSLIGTVGWVDGKLTSYSSRGSNETAILGSGALSVSSDGYKPRYVPAWTLSFGPTIHGTLARRNWNLRADVLYSSGFYVDYSQLDYNPGAARVNLRAGIDLVEGTNLEIYVSNLTNTKRVPTGATTTGPANSRIVFTEAYVKREVGLRLRAEF